MSNRFVAAVLEFFGVDQGLNGGDLEFGDEIDGFGGYAEETPGGVYPLRTERTQFSGMAIIRAKPETIDEAPQVAEQIKGQLPVIVNLEDVPDSEARRIVDFLGGVVYGLNGSMKKVARSVFICSPFDVPVEQLSISAGRGGPIPRDEEEADLRASSF
ncbi:MAG: cell division protein SepF [candidate division WS1 bacterium]|jgi:cell division inhibitor SepF|nr:cell division protein SepF [candidate division WS1 bacterium]